MCPAKASVTLKGAIDMGIGGLEQRLLCHGGLQSEFDQASKEFYKKKKKKSRKRCFPITNTKIRMLKDLTEKVKPYYNMHIINSCFIDFKKLSIR